MRRAGPPLPPAILAVVAAGALCVASAIGAACADVAPPVYDPRPLGASPDDAGARAASGDDAGTADDDATSAPDAPPPTSDPGAAAWRDRVLYLVLPDRFANGDPSNDASGVAGCFDPNDPTKSHGGDLAGVRQHVAHLRDLGVGALWITPQYVDAPSPGRCGYHGYWPDFTAPDDGAIEPTMGDAAALAGLRDDLHAAGIRLVLDMVVNHAGRGARIVAQRPDWFHDPATCAQLGDPAVYCPIGVRPLPDFAQEKPEVASYLTATSVGWAQRFALDGVRMDTAKHVPIPYWRDSWFPAMRAARPGLFTVGEVLDESGAAALAPFLQAGFDSLFNYPLYAALVATFANGGAVDAVADAIADDVRTLGLDAALRLTTFLDNHDQPRFATLASTSAGAANDADALRRLHLALGALFTLPGIPQLYYGDELAMLGGKDPDNRRDFPAWGWTASGRGVAHPGEALGTPGATYALVQKLVATRAQHPALRRGRYVEGWRKAGGAANLLAFVRADADDRIVVAINAGASAASVSLPLQKNAGLGASDRAALADGAALDDLLGEGAPTTVTVAAGALAIALPAQTMAIYRARK